MKRDRRLTPPNTVPAKEWRRFNDRHSNVNPDATTRSGKYFWEEVGRKLRNRRIN